MFPLLYHVHHTLHSDDLPLWLRFAEQQGDPILELGCGTGRVLIPLSQKGYRIYGLDSDLGMLSVLRVHLEGDVSHIFQADMAAFHLAERFPLILLPCNTLSTLAAPTRRATLQRVWEHLCADGLFAASLPNPALLARLPRYSSPEIEDIFSHPLDGEPVQVSSSWERTTHHLTFSWRYDHLLPNGHIERLTAQTRHELLSIEGYLAEFRAVGLAVEVTYGDFDNSPYTRDSTHLIIVARLP